jgi:hypothetical protein
VEQEVQVAAGQDQGRRHGMLLTARVLTDGTTGSGERAGTAAVTLTHVGATLASRCGSPCQGRRLSCGSASELGIRVAGHDQAGIQFEHLTCISA